MEIEYRRGNQLDIDEVVELYFASTLGERRPADNREYMTQMIEEANLVITAWEGDLLVGISRSLTDWCYVAYLSDLAVRKSHQHHGIGKELIRQSQDALGKDATLILLSAPAAEGYYPKIGMKSHPSAWLLRPGDPLT